MDRRTTGGGATPHIRGRPVSGSEAAHANEYFEPFISATTLKNILGYHRSMCEFLHLKPNVFPHFYPKLRANLTSWKAKALWKKFDARISHKCYGKGKACANHKVLIIGAGPCGLRTAIEAQLLGAKVVVVEKRDRLSRNNVLHLWPFVIEDLRMMGAKKFFGKFCAGSIDHISIRQLQCILLKVALLLGVEVHTEVSFEGLMEPASEKAGWRAEIKPESHPVSQYEFDIIIGADGKRNTLEGFKRKEFRGKLAIAITANFINKKTEAEARVEEISGVAFIFNQKFFKDLHEETRIDLENIVYYKDDTHYFVMTAKKASLLEKGVIKQDLSDTEKLLATDNVDRDALQNYARQAADFSTNYQLPELEFAVNHYGQPDVAMFDFTSMYAAEYASKFVERNGSRLLMILVGDSLLEPFWPTGSGCARGFLSSLDAAWAIRSYCSNQMTPLDVLAERESIYRLLAQTTPDNLNKVWKSYTLDPATRYPNLNKSCVTPHQTACLYDTDDPNSIDKMKRASLGSRQEHLPKKRRKVDNEVLLTWLSEQLRFYEDIEVSDINSVFRNGKTLCAIIHHYRPDLLDYSAIIANNEPSKCNQMAIDILEKDLGVMPVMTGDEITYQQDDRGVSASFYLTQVYYTFRGEIPHIKHPKLVSAKVNCPVAKHLSKTTLMKETHARNVEIKPLKRHKPPRIIPTRILSEETFLNANIKSEKRCRKPKRDYFDVTYNNGDLIDINFQNDLKKLKKLFEAKQIQSKDAAVYANNENDIKKRDVSVGFGSSLKVFSCETFLHGLDPCPEYKPLNHLPCERGDSQPVEIVYRSKRKNRTIERIRKHLAKKRKQLNNVLSKKLLKQSSKESINIENQSSSHSINVQIIHNSGTNITCQYKSSMNVIKISKDDNVKGKTVLRPFQMRSRKFPKKMAPIGEVVTKQLEPSPVDYQYITLLGKSNDRLFKDKLNYFSKTMRSMKLYDHYVEPFSHVTKWVYASDFEREDERQAKIPNDLPSDITSVTGPLRKLRGEYDDIKVEQRTEVIRCDNNSNSQLSDGEGMKNLVQSLKNMKTVKKEIAAKPLTTKFSLFKSVSAPPMNFSIIPEGEEFELPDSKKSEVSFKTVKTSGSNQQVVATIPARPSSRHKRPSDILTGTKSTNIDRKPRKRRTLERVHNYIEERQRTLQEIEDNRADRQSKRKQQRLRQTERFIKSMQMLQANCKPDCSEPFEDYTIFLYRQTAPKFEDRVKDLEKQFTYIPDHDNKVTGLKPLANTNAEEDVASKIKSLEDKWSNKQPTERKPKDLMRAIGKIETSDWNIKQIEKKILENKIGKPSTMNVDKERVPRWSKEEFRARQRKMEKKHMEDKQDNAETKYADIDRNIKQLDLKLKEGTNRELGQNKVASITEKLASKVPQEQPPPTDKPAQTKPVYLPAQNPSEYCHFCSKRVYLMERLSAEARFFHHGCFKCQYCHTQLRLGSYMFDRDGQYGYRFFCVHHYGMQGELPRPTKVTRRPSHKREVGKSPQKKLSGIAGVDLLDRVQTPERIQFDNLSGAAPQSDQWWNSSQMDEDEWTDKNFGASCNELDDSDEDSSSSLSDTDSDCEEDFQDAMEQPITKEGTMKWAERLRNSYKKGHHHHHHHHHSDSDEFSSSDHSSYYENSTDESDSETATEGEDEIRARELRKQEVRVEPPVAQTDTGTDTEMVSQESSSGSSSEIQNSATEISTDSEFAQDDPTPTRDVPAIMLNDIFVTKTRGSGQNYPKRFQVTSGFIGKKSEEPAKKKKPDSIDLKLRPLVTSNFQKILPRPDAAGYALNRTQSTGGIAAKVSLELKKKYLLGESGPNSIQKSGSASTLDTKFKSFQTTISDCQKLLKPATEVSAGMQVFCNKLDEKLSPQSGGFAYTGVTKEPTKPLPDITITTVIVDNNYDVDNGRPRSPVHETTIEVPSIAWSKQSESDSDNSEPLKSFDNQPLDSLMEVKETRSTFSEKKSLNQPKSLPNLETTYPEIHKALHVKLPLKDDESLEEVNSCKSGKSSPEVTVLTETELSDWARDENVSDNSIELDVVSDKKKLMKMADLSEFDEAINQHVCGKQSTLSNLDSIEYMDTDTSEEGEQNSQNGYVLFKDEEDSLNVQPNEVFEARNVCLTDSFGSTVTELNVNDLERLKLKQAQTAHEEDSLIIIEPGTTTEENTCSDSTVKNLTEVKPALKLENLQKQRLEDKLAKVKAELKEKENIENNLQYVEHCQRLQSKVDFGNAKDSIDIRKSRRKSKSDSPQKPDLIQEEPKEISLDLSPVIIRPPESLYKKENIKKERDVNKKLIEEMVMNKMRAENKSLERKKRSRSNLSSLSPCRPQNSVLQINLKNSERFILPETPLTNPESFNMKSQTPIAPPRLNRPSDLAKTAEKLKESARARARLLSNEDLGLSPDDKLVKLREKAGKRQNDRLVQDGIESLVLNTERRNSLLYSNDTLTKKRNNSFRRSKSGETTSRPKSVADFPKNFTISKPADEANMCKSDPNLLASSKLQPAKKKSKDRERRKSITKMIVGFFSKQSPGTAGGLFAKLSPKSKSKSLTSLDLHKNEGVATEETAPKKSHSEISICVREPTPPPIPPLPESYTLKATDESSDGEAHKDSLQYPSSCDTLDQKKTEKARRFSKQVQVKRHRIAQEIQRKLEETDVKTRELERRGVALEKALRGEDDGRCSRDESDVLQEWFELMRDRAELSRFERELRVRGQELELEDRHSRLQLELRERLECNENKTEEDLKIEQSIINEMMDIVAKRDTLISGLEEDRLRYLDEDKDLEEQMLEKGLMLTPIEKSPEK